MTAISVIIPAYEAARTLGETLESVLRQTTPVTEVIVVDDGSTDRTADVALSFSGVRLLRQKNAGPGAALNTGAAEASGDFLVFLDADDLLMADAVASHLACFVDNAEADAAVGFMEEFVCPSEDAAAATEFRPRACQPGWLSGATALRAETFRRVGLFDAKLRAGHWIDWMDRAKLAGLRFCVHDTIVLRRRLHSGSLSMKSGIKNGKGLLSAARNALLRRRAAERSVNGA